MNWIKENKFLTGFFAVMLAGVAALGYLLFAAMGKAEEATNRYNETSSELTRLQGLPVSPSKKNLDVLVAQKEDAIKAIADFQAMLAKKSFPLEPMTPEAFQDKLKATRNAVVEKAQGTKLLPEKFFLGFDVYETRPPDREAAAPLGRELKAIEWIVNQMVESRVTEIKGNLKREPLPEESGKARSGEKGDKKNRPLVTTHSVEFTFEARQTALGSLLNALISPKAPQFFVIRSIKVKNQNEKGPPRVDPNAAAGAAVAAPGEPAAPLKPVSSYIVGEELLEVTLVIDIVDFAEPATTAAK